MRSRILECDYCGKYSELEDTEGWDTLSTMVSCDTCSSELMEADMEKYNKSKMAKVVVPIKHGYDLVGSSLITPENYVYPIRFNDVGQLEYETDGSSITAVIYYQPNQAGNIAGIRASNIIWYQE